MRGINKIIVTIAGLLVAVGAFVALTSLSAQAVSTFRNCNDDAIVRCGAITEKELLEKYDANAGDVQNIYKHYGITRADIAGTASTIVHATVHKDGRVVVDGKTIAANAHSVSRIAYSNKDGVKPNPVTINGTTLYEGPNMNIFTGSVSAYVFLRDGVFHKAILSSCANPLIATPTEKPAPKPQPKPVTPKPQPKPQPEKPVQPKPEVEKCELPGKEHLPKDSPECAETPVVPEVPVTPETPIVPEELPKTGLGAFLGGGLSLGSIIAAGNYWFTSRKNLAQTLLNK